MKRIILSPFSLYIIAYCGVLFLYFLHWSELFPPPNISLIIFLIVTFIISLIGGIIYYKYRKSNLSHLDLPDSFFKKSQKWITIGYILEFLYSRRIPLFSLSNVDESFEHFGGIPTLHVILVTYNVFFSVLYFQKLLQENIFKQIWYKFLLIGFMPPILIVNRGMLFTIFISCLLMYIIMSKSKITQILLKCVLIVSLLLIIFSYLGKLRINDTDGNRAFTSFSHPTKEFYDLNIDPIMMWPYMYMASPIANLDNCVDQAQPEYNLHKFIWGCICPDFISKRIVNNDNLATESHLISPVFNVSTMYNKAYITMGFYGMFLLFMYQTVLVITFLFTSTPRTNQYYSVTFCLLSATIILGTFTNMWIFSAVSFPILWSPILNFASKWKIRLKLS